MKVLIGTTNPAKVGRFADFLPDHGIEFLTLKDLNITAEPEKAGHDPEENARIKAAFYGQFCDAVICNDSGLYFDSLPLDDPRQPGLNIRSPQGRRLDDEEMIAYYSDLVARLGGKALAYYMDGIAVCRRGKVWGTDCHVAIAPRNDGNKKRPDRSVRAFYIWGNYLWILPEPSPPASFSTSATVTIL